MLACLSALMLTFASGLFCIPEPKTVAEFPGQLNLSNARIIAKQASLVPLADIVNSEAGRLGYKNWTKTTDGSKATIILNIDPKLASAYTLKADKQIVITGRDYKGVVWGTATMLQCLGVDGEKVAMPKVSISDSPDSDYRGVLVDVARKYHSIDTLKQIVELCRWYKINYLQLHLTDDQSFTFPSKAFPKLNTSNQHGGPSYTEQELRDLVAFADARGVTIIPEFDIPGHSATMVRTMPELFKIAGTKPYEHHATINFANPDVLKAVDTLIGEMCDIFKSSPYFHMGGDEADYSNADQHPDFQAAFLKNGLTGKATHEIYRLFLTQVNEMIKKRGKKTIVWEGFGRDPNSKFPIPKDITVIEFESAYYLPTDLLEDGYTVINAAWTPLYVVNEHVWPSQKIFDWDLRKFGRFSTFYPATTWFEVPTYKGIIGGQVCAWEQPEYMAFDHLRRIVPAMAERTWNRQPRISYEEYEKRSTLNEALLTKLALDVEIRSSSVAKNDADSFDVVRFRGSARITLHSLLNLPIHYTLDGTKPTSASPLYESGITIDQTTTIRAMSVNSDGSYRESARTYYKDVSSTPNLATKKPVTVSGGTQGPQVPEFAVDNDLNIGSSWWASPAPQWLQVDLQRAYTVDKIDVFPYWDGRRYYRYTVEVSVDGKQWTQVVDKSQNTVPASASGDEHKIAPVSARYVRVNMLSNSANEGVHLVELRVWGK